MIHFSQDTLDFLEEKLKENYEICSSLDVNDQGEYEIKQYSSAPPITLSNGSFRGVCFWNDIKLTPVILHTHPISSKSYPSKEDYSKVWKDKYVNVVYSSLIVTPVGIFQMINTKYETGYKIPKIKEDILNTIISKYTDKKFYPVYDKWRKQLISTEDLQQNYKTIANELNTKQSRFKLIFYPNN